MMRRITMLAMLLICAAANSEVQAQSVRQPYPPRHSSGRSAESPSWWNGQVKSFQRRWGLAEPKKVVVKKQAVPRPTAPHSAPVYHAGHRVGGSAAPIQLVGHQIPAAGHPVPATAPYGVPMPQPTYGATPPAAGGGIAMGGYPQFDAALYPTPRPDIPYQVGGAAITNQAFAPHEMLYPHKYKALYPPYYYKVHGGWFVTPWGVVSHDRWELDGTEVEVNYRPKISLFSGFSPPTQVSHWKHFDK